jgi:hypothetical protein
VSRGQLDQALIKPLSIKSSDEGRANRQNVLGFGWTNAAFLALLHALPPEMARKLAAEQTIRAD